MSAGRAMAEMLMRIAESERKNVQVRIWGLHIFCLEKLNGRKNGIFIKMY